MAEIGVTQTQLGQQIGMPQVLVSKRMRGVVPWKVDEVVDIAQALDVPLERILPLDELAGRRAS
jgi:transcriptional regulator with XRE-family HTH domain